MKLAVLGCYAGIGGARRTTALLLDDDVLIDAGSGVGELSLEQMVKVDHVFLTHSHLDHCGFIDRKSTRLNSSHLVISYAVFCLKKKNTNNNRPTDAHVHNTTPDRT